MKNGIFISLMMLASMTAIASENKPELRMIETTPELAALFDNHFAARIQMVGEVMPALANENQERVWLLVPMDLIPDLAELSHEVNGKCGGFTDITDEDQEVLATAQITAKDDTYDLPKIGERDPKVVKMVQDIKGENIKTFVQKYSGNFSTRVATSPEGEEAPKWLANEWKNMAAAAGRTDIAVDLISPPSGYKQYNVRVTIPGSDGNLPAVIVGGHLDSINQKDGKKAPGIDDNGSGISAITEMYRVLLASDFRPRATLEIMGYSAEELGLLGSRAVAENYYKTGVKVRAVMQLDMVSFPGESESVTFIDDRTDPALTTWTEQLYGLYVGLKVLHDTCGYGCSDHASWNRYGYASVFPFEAPDQEMNRNIHSTRDVWMSTSSAEHAAKFSKLAVAFAVELTK